MISTLSPRCAYRVVDRLAADGEQREPVVRPERDQRVHRPRRAVRETGAPGVEAVVEVRQWAAAAAVGRRAGNQDQGRGQDEAETFG
ncbi:hypothetical protein [Streptomyces sp. x-80]|uniref:hypothetical protein n=1 Tax=Streptomyces sp. x-80 TaxID=2789282 RepID=UPI0039813563